MSFNKPPKKLTSSKNAAKAGMPHKYKTEMCRNVMQGKECQFGKNCNYAHSEKELRQDIEEDNKTEQISSPSLFPAKSQDLRLSETNTKTEEFIFKPSYELYADEPEWIKKLKFDQK